MSKHAPHKVTRGYCIQIALPDALFKDAKKNGIGVTVLHLPIAESYVFGSLKLICHPPGGNFQVSDSVIIKLLNQVKFDLITSISRTLLSLPLFT